MNYYLLLLVSMIAFQKPNAREIQSHIQFSRNQNMLVCASNLADTSTIKNRMGNLQISINRNSTRVNIQWITTLEKNNRGFYVQRKIKGEWKNIAFVFSAADSGSSSKELTYLYRDNNSQRKTTNYRIQQIDMSGSGVYSEVFSVPGRKRRV